MTIVLKYENNLEIYGFLASSSYMSVMAYTSNSDDIFADFNTLLLIFQTH